MQEGDAVLASYDTVVTSREILGSGKLITRLETLTLGEHNVLGAPRLISHLHIGLLFLYRHFYMDHRLVDVRPEHHPRLAVRHLPVAVFHHQLLAQRLRAQGVGEVYAESSQLQQRVVLVEASAAAQVEQHVALFRPYIHAHVAAAAGHRLRAVAAFRRPFIGLRLCPQMQEHQRER